MGIDKLCGFCIHRHGQNPKCFTGDVTGVSKKECPVEICTERMISAIMSVKQKRMVKK